MNDPMHDDPAHWTRGPIKLYFARDDRRFIVPKYHRALGWTINLGHPAGGVAVLGLILVVPLMLALATALHG